MKIIDEKEKQKKKKKKKTLTIAKSFALHANGKKQWQLQSLLRYTQMQ